LFLLTKTVAHQAADYAPAGEADSLAGNLIDIHRQRLELMDKLGVEMQVLSLTSPGPQGKLPSHKSGLTDLTGLSDPTEAAALATHANNVLVRQPI